MGRLHCRLSYQNPAEAPCMAGRFGTPHVITGASRRCSGSVDPHGRRPAVDNRLRKEYCAARTQHPALATPLGSEGSRDKRLLRGASTTPE
jgi:hypothetical protein